MALFRGASVTTVGPTAATVLTVAAAGTALGFGVVSNPPLTVLSAAMLSLAWLFFLDLRLGLLILIASGLYVFFPFASAPLSRLVSSNLVLFVLLGVWLAKTLTSKGPTIPETGINRPLFGILGVLVLSMVYNAFFPESGVVYKFALSDAPYPVIWLTQLAILIATVLIPYMVMAAVRTERDIELGVNALIAVSFIAAGLSVYNFLTGAGGADILGYKRSAWSGPTVIIIPIALCFAYARLLHPTSFANMVRDGFVVAVLLAGGIVTFQRSVWAYMASALLLALVFRKTGRLEPKAVTLCGLIFLGVAVASSPEVVKPITDFYTPGVVYGLERTEMYARSFSLFLSHPILGIGPGNSQFFYRWVLGTANVPFASGGGASHNGYITVLAEGGLFALLLYLWFMYSVVRCAYALYRQAGETFQRWFSLGALVFSLVWAESGLFGETAFSTVAYGGGLGWFAAIIYFWVALGFLLAIAKGFQSQALASPVSLQARGTRR